MSNDVRFPKAIGKMPKPANPIVCTVPPTRAFCVRSSIASDFAGCHDQQTDKQKTDREVCGVVETRWNDGFHQLAGKALVQAGPDAKAGSRGRADRAQAAGGA